MRKSKGKARSRSANDPRQLELFTLTPKEVETVKAFASTYKMRQDYLLRNALMLGFECLSRKIGCPVPLRERFEPNVIAVNFSESVGGKEVC